MLVVAPAARGCRFWLSDPDPAIERAEEVQRGDRRAHGGGGHRRRRRHRRVRPAARAPGRAGDLRGRRDRALRTPPTTRAELLEDGIVEQADGALLPARPAHRRRVPVLAARARGHVHRAPTTSGSGTSGVRTSSPGQHEPRQHRHEARGPSGSAGRFSASSSRASTASHTRRLGRVVADLAGQPRQVDRLGGVHALQRLAGGVGEEGPDPVEQQVAPGRARRGAGPRSSGSSPASSRSIWPPAIARARRPRPGRPAARSAGTAPRPRRGCRRARRRPAGPGPGAPATAAPAGRRRSTTRCRRTGWAARARRARSRPGRRSPRGRGSRCPGGCAELDHVAPERGDPAPGVHEQRHRAPGPARRSAPRRARPSRSPRRAGGASAPGAGVQGALPLGHRVVARIEPGEGHQPAVRTRSASSRTQSLAFG